MKHKALWVFATWILTISLFELPLNCDFVENVLMESIMEGYGSSIVIVICDLYVIASLIALAMAKYIIETVDNMKTGE